MRLRTALILGAVVVVTIILIVRSKDRRWMKPKYWETRFFASPSSVYANSDGTFDEAARMALERVTGRTNPTAEDHHLAARILTNNIIALEADTKEARAARRNAVADAREHHAAALAAMRVNNRTAANRVVHTPPMVIIDHALDFAVNLPFLWMDIVPHEDEGPGVIFLGEMLAEGAAAARDLEINRRRDVARVISETPGGRADAYLAAAAARTSDSQNVHDSSVNGCLRAIVGRLRGDVKTRGATLPSLDEVAEIMTRVPKDTRPINVSENAHNEAHESRKKDVLAVITRARAGERNVAVDVTDKEAIQLVAARAAHPHNAANRDSIHRALFDALASCWEPGISGERHMVCVNGRTGQALSALAILDFDARNTEVTTLQQLKADIFAATKNLIATEAATAAASSDAKLHAVGASYTAKTKAELDALGTLDPTSVKEFEDRLRAAIANLVDDHISKINANGGNTITPIAAESIKSEALAAV